MLRRARAPDAAPVIAHVREVASERVYLMTERVHRTVAEERKVFRELAGASGLFLVAVVDGKIVGTADFRRGAASKNRHVAQLGLALRKDARGVGLGTAMMEMGIDWARSVGIRKLRLGVFATNRPALALYRRLGFVREGRLRREVVLNGRPVDEILMALWL